MAPLPPRTEQPFFGRDPMASSRIPIVTTNDEARDLAGKLEMSTAEIGLTVRTTNCLEERGIFTVGELLNSTREDLLAISNFGEKTLEEVYRALERVGFYRKSVEPAGSGPPNRPR
jgi:DNA-directed RNA polymerase subunit alpha